MELTVVIVNYRVKYLLEQTLRSVEQAMQGIAGEVIVVDNLSGDDSIAFSRERHPGVTYIENQENVGFARANNQAIMQARGEYTLILNPDTIITPRCLQDGIAWMRSHPKCGAIGARMMDGNGVFLPESKRSFPTPWVSFCKIFGLSKLFPRSPWFAKYHLRYLSDLEPQCIDILSGAYMLCRTNVLQQLGGFDEDFFMYGEDIDLSYRIVKAGYENWFLPTPMVHYKGESTHKDSMRYVRVFYFLPHRQTGCDGARRHGDGQAVDQAHAAQGRQTRHRIVALGHHQRQSPSSGRASRHRQFPGQHPHDRQLQRAHRRRLPQLCPSGGLHSQAQRRQPPSLSYICRPPRHHHLP